MMTRYAHGLWIAGLVLALSSSPLTAQLPAGTAAALGTGNNYSTLARGVSAMGVNPAGLGMPDSPEFSLALLPVSARQALDPVGFSDLSDFGGELIGDRTKEDWLRRISDAGGETGGFGADITGLAFTAGPVGVQLSTLVRGQATLNEAGAELLLYGNAGRTGEAKDFDLQGSSFHTLAVSTIGLSFGLPVSVEGIEGATATLAVGGTLKYSMGHLLAFAEDAGSQVRSDPLSVSVNFPMIVPDSADSGVNHGTGVGLDLGANWRRGPLALAFVVQNLFHSFEWVLDDMSFIPGTVFWDADADGESDFDHRPVAEAPAALREGAEELKFKPRISLGVAYDADEDLTLTGEVQKRLGDGIEVAPDLHIGIGMETRALPFLPLRLGAAKVTDGFQIGGGFTLGLGPVHLSFAGAVQKGDIDGSLGSFSLSFGGF
jgi:hypothetical protein